MTLLLKPEQLSWAVQLLRRGQPVGLPTETVYGLAAPATDVAALARVFALKARPTFDPLIVHVRDLNEARRYAKSVSPLHQKLCEAFWPGPLTLLFEKSERVPDLCTAGTGWVAMRSPKHPVFRACLQELDQALAAPSANRFGRISPTEAQHVIDELGPYGLEAVVDGGSCEWGLESTVVKVHSGKLEVIRLGAIGPDQLQNFGVPLELRPSGSGQLEEAPGQLASHYAPRAPLYLFPDLQKILAPEQAALLSVGPIPAELAALPWRYRRVLSESNSDVEAASRLFKTMRELDELKPAYILAVPSPSAVGLAPAINDRLRRASCINSVRNDAKNPAPGSD